MKTVELTKLGLEEMNQIESSTISGGAPWIYFIAKAIIGGIVYESWKAGTTAYVNACYNGSMDPAIRPSR
jgi:hypothetical protein